MRGRWGLSVGQIVGSSGDSKTEADVFECPECFSLVRRNRTDAHARWHTQLEASIPSERRLQRGW